MASGGGRQRLAVARVAQPLVRQGLRHLSQLSEGKIVPVPNTESADIAAAGPRNDGLGRVLITAYLILALAASLRAVYQLISKFDEAPLAYGLSLLSGLVYVVATFALLKRGQGAGWRALAWGALIFEFAGVLVVGTLSITHPELFAHDSVWSFFGSGYLFIPLVLPLLGMIWLRREAHPAAPQIEIADPNESLY